MSKYQVGDVVWALVPFGERIGVKIRPAIILDVKSPPTRYLLIECSSLKDKHSNQKGITVLSGEKHYIECGFQEDTFITQNKCWLSEHLLKPHHTYGGNPMGKCNFLDEVKELIMKK